MAFPKAASCILWICAIVGPAAPLGVEASQLRARAPPPGGNAPRSDAPAVTSDAASPADVEDAEDLIDSDQAPTGGDQPALAQLFSQAALPAQLPATVPQEAVLADVPQQVVPATVPQQAAPAASTGVAAPRLPVAEPEAVFQFA